MKLPVMNNNTCQNLSLTMNREIDGKYSSFVGFIFEKWGQNLLYKGKKTQIPQITQCQSFAPVSQFSDINFDGFNLQ
jgi:hypothetical protein